MFVLLKNGLTKSKWTMRNNVREPLCCLSWTPIFHVPHSIHASLCVQAISVPHACFKNLQLCRDKVSNHLSYHNSLGHAVIWCRMRWKGEIFLKLFVTMAQCSRRGYIALGSQLCWAWSEPALSWAHYLYHFAYTRGTMREDSVLQHTLLISKICHPFIRMQIQYACTLS